MKPLPALLAFLWLSPIILLVNSCSGAGLNHKPPADIVLVASTPGDAPIKTLLAIPAETKIDFIRWDLTLQDVHQNPNTFVLHIAFGEGKPNTMGFMEGSGKRTFEGTYTISKAKTGKLREEVYRLKTKDLARVISMVKLNDNLFHLLTAESKLFVGNGGWSYTLNRKEPIATAADLPALAGAGILEDTARQVVFDGRTPCQEIAKENNQAVVPACFKLKWRLILNRDPKTLLPITYQLWGVTDRRTDVVGKWRILKGTPANPDAIIYQLDPEQPGKTLSFLVGDENVLFFLKKDLTLYVGNPDFSFSLNRKSK